MLMFHKTKVKEGGGVQILGKLRVSIGMAKSRHALLVGSNIVNLGLQLSRWEDLGEGFLQTTGGDPSHHRIWRHAPSRFFRSWAQVGA